MVMDKIKKNMGKAALSLFLTVQLMLLLDLVMVLCGKPLAMKWFMLITFAVFCFLCFVPFITQKMRKIAVIGISLGAVLVALVVPFWYAVSSNAVYDAPDAGKSALYSGKNVMVLSPHQDDEINMLGGILEQYVKYGSNVTVVFSTNGDYEGLGETRLREAVDVMSFIGIPQENVIFLGYGDQWKEGTPHLYNTSGGAVATSYTGRTETYGSAQFPAYREGAAYTRENFLQDIESVILEYKPDLLYCVDYEGHIDHMALSLAFDNVMGKILQEQADYRPQVMKAYAYSAAWVAAKDFYSENLLSTQNIFTKERPQKQHIYRWEERLRLPVDPDSLSRSLISSDIYKAFAMHRSQYAWVQAPGVINGDKICWPRYTQSLSYEARFETSSGSAALLNNFMLLDCDHLAIDQYIPTDGVWIPAEDDAEKTVTVTFDAPEYIDSIVLYDHPDESINVLGACITFDDGTMLETGPLATGGAATEISVQKADVTGFTVALTEQEGTAGLSEIEIFAEDPEITLPLIKIMDEDENFVYDYWITPAGVQRFYLYGANADPEACTLTCSNSACSAQWEDGALLVECPAGESCMITVATDDGNLSDTVRIQNPGKLERQWVMSLIRLEAAVMDACDQHLLYKNLILHRIGSKIIDLLQ